MKFRIKPTINRNGKLEYYVEKKKFLGWKSEVKIYGYMKTLTSIYYFETPEKAYDHIREEYGASVNIIRWKP